MTLQFLFPALHPKDTFVNTSRPFFSVVKRQKLEIIIPVTIVLEVDNILSKASQGQKENIGQIFLQDKAISIIYLDRDFLDKYLVSYFQV